MESSTASPPRSDAADASTRPGRRPLAEAARLQARLANDQAFLVISAAVILASVVLTTDTQAVQLFGWTLPPLCPVKLLTGHDCLGCGLTRSFVFMGHGELGAAFGRHKLGPLLYLIVLAQVPLRAALLWQGRRRLAALGAGHPPVGG